MLVSFIKRKKEETKTRGIPLSQDPQFDAKDMMLSRNRNRLVTSM